MTYVTMVAYPAVAGAKFDLQYYTNNHMQTVNKHWKQYGLLDWKVITFDAAGPDDTKPYSVASTMTWSSAEAFQKAMSSEIAGVLTEDLKNFSDQSPIFLVGNVAASSA
ncbi:hypothetical protein LTR10_016002 [Elasticomyces elasticus]|uniref:EthD domain-containing protein n=1 Tax=Exophiala sideris TaxID=1016849 RepID=A0ABR0J3M9_9EURO|nr:hypothetical protein LTR10_016002 [Elasticomyces elasticus]KAK5024660.1 hypothetical protein LTS07_008506 [Exophiala sideris]KAK5030753.1 hypothetical protein LTR13_008107 [Exophiala sideris]KAK5054294.1 hypothetical protein LTR69_008909 [Exophiala sideris]KAK5179696.1 hypothetical protein LTR44_007864 [Eurotiomycetes sp. CCFEE 6388]